MVRYTLYQDNSKNSTTRGMWYGRAKMTGETGLNTLAQRIQRNCTVKRSDVMAVLTELVEVMQDELQASHRVKLDGFGAFKLGMRTKGAETPKLFTPVANVKSLHVLFQPEVHVDRNNKSRIRTFLTGTVVREADSYYVEKEEEQEP